jgi:formate hydrogenlyase subunit 3/multisubunit Na+/H+ antiporter MnhD subunit
LAPETGGQLWNTGIPLSSSLAYLAFFCILIAAFAKAGGFPLHTWVPEFAKDAPIESAAFLPASLDKLLGIYLLARMVIQLFVLNTVMHLIIMTLGALTVITAVMMAMIQHNGRKLLGYHAVSQVGYMILGVGSGNVLAFIGGLFHMINHTIYKSNLFLSLGAVEKKTGTSELDELGGLARNMPITFITAAIGAFAISGIPPFNGFFSKWMIYQGVLDQAKSAAAGFQIWYLICLILAVFGSALTLASFMKFLHAIFLGRRPKTLAEVREAPFNQWFATGMLALLCILFGLFAIKGPLNFFLNPIVSQFGWTTPQMLGDYQPGFILIMILIPFLLGLFLYRMIRNVRFDEIYLGGMTAEEKFRILGTEFYKEIKNMVPLKAIYQGAEKKYFDVYALGSRFSGWCASLFQGLHRGQLQIYSLWIILGTIILIWIVK